MIFRIIIDMTKKYNAIANVALILAAVYALVSIPAAIIGLYRGFNGISLSAFASQYAGNTALGIFIFIFRIILTVAGSVLWLIWIRNIIKDKESIRFPVIATFSYYAAELIYYAINNIIGHETMIELIKERYLTFFIMAAWLVLIIKTDEIHRKVFAVIRSLILVLSFIFTFIHYVSVINNRIEFGTALMASDYIGIVDACFRFFIIALFIIRIFNPKVFYRTSHEEEI